MFFRCPECSTRSMVKPWPPGTQPTLSCAACGKSFAPGPTFNQSFTEQERHEEAARLAAAARIDLPTANSVLLGLMTAQRAQEVCAEATSARPARRESQSTPTQASAPAAPSAPSAAQRSGPTPRAARQRPPVAEPSAKPGRARLLLAWSFPVLLVVAVGIAVMLVRAPAPDAQAAQELLRSIRLETDSSGRVTRIAAADAPDVLLGLLQVDPSLAAYEPVEVVVLPEPNVRLGILREREEPGARLAVEIRREEGGSQHWVVGDGSSRVEPRPAPPVAPGAATIPVARRVR